MCDLHVSAEGERCVACNQSSAVFLTDGLLITIIRLLVLPALVLPNVLASSDISLVSTLAVTAKHNADVMCAVWCTLR